MFLEGSKWIAGKDSNLSFWTDKWLSKGTLRSLIEGPLKRGEDLLLLRNVVGFSGWNWHSSLSTSQSIWLLKLKLPLSLSLLPVMIGSLGFPPPTESSISKKLIRSLAWRRQ